MKDEKSVNEEPTVEPVAEVDDTPVAATGLTSRVADSYGYNPHEHKPSQDPFDADTAEEKQAETGDAGWRGTSSSDSDSSEQSSELKPESSISEPAPTTVSPTAPDRTASSTAPSTGTARKTK